LLGRTASGESIEVALRDLMARSIVVIGSSGAVTYPQFTKGAAAGAGETSLR
jgi:peroxiredoxin